MADPLLRIEDLRVEFRTEDGLVVAVDGLTFEVGRGRVVGLVGESGCGKSVTGYSILSLLQRPGRVVDGSILFWPEPGGDPIDLTKLQQDSEALRSIRGNRIAMIFQEPMGSLTPVYTIGAQIVEAIRAHSGRQAREARSQAVDLLRRVGIPAPEKRVDAYPHELSGGMRQRALIAMALSCSPDLLIADEPTTALDVTVQAQIMDLLREQRSSTALSILIITHDMGIIADIADDVVVMYAGMAVETAPVEAIFASPQHPYTQGLLSSIPGAKRRKGEKLTTIEGVVPDSRNRPNGCLYAPRCPERFERCDNERPALVPCGTGRCVACWARIREQGGAP